MKISRELNIDYLADNHVLERNYGSSCMFNFIDTKARYLNVTELLA